MAKPNMDLVRKLAKARSATKLEETLSKGYKSLMPNIDELDEYGKTALMHAAYAGHVPTIKVLIKYGAVININTDGEDVTGWRHCVGNTALHFACIMGRLSAARFLVAAGADFHITNGSYLNAANYAKKFHRKPLTDWLEAVAGDPSLIREARKEFDVKALEIENSAMEERFEKVVGRAYDAPSDDDDSDAGLYTGSEYGTALTAMTKAERKALAAAGRALVVDP